MAFNVARHPAFVAAVKATLMAGFDYIPPLYPAMQTKDIANFNLLVPLAACLEVQFMHRWDMMIMDLHYAGALLNPFLMNVMEIQNNGIAKHV